MPFSPPPPRPTSHTASQFAVIRRSPYYNIDAAPAKSKTITDVRDVSSRISSDGIFFTASGRYAAVALSKIEGTVAVFDLDVCGRIPAGTLDAIFNNAPVLDLQFDPFHDTKILCALSTGVIKVWDISEADYFTNRIPPRRELEPEMRNIIVEEDSNHLTLKKLSPVAEIRCELSKIVLARYNPVVESLVAVAGGNGDILVVNLETGAEIIKVQFHSSAIVSLSWSSDGSSLISVDQDNVFIVSDIRRKGDGILAKTQVKNARFPRAIFTGPIGNEYIFVNYLQGTLHKWLLMDINLKPIKEEYLGSPQGSQGFRSIYDYDSSIVFMSSRSTPQILMLRITSGGVVQEIQQTTKLSEQHQAIALMPKKVVDCSKSEIVRMLRITKNSIETTPFVVPRREKNVFLRELYPKALVTWVPAMTLEEWLQFTPPSCKFIDLKHDDLHEMLFERHNLLPSASTKHNEKSDSTTKCIIGLSIGFGSILLLITVILFVGFKCNCAGNIEDQATLIYHFYEPHQVNHNDALEIRRQNPFNTKYTFDEEMNVSINSSKCSFSCH